MKKGKGFTLDELILVVAIIGILTSILVPAYNEHQHKKRQEISNGINENTTSEGLK